MAIINARWPRALAPDTCRFGRSRNDKLQISPATRQHSVLRSGRPLWGAQLSWSLPNGDKLAELRYFLEGLDGFTGSVQLWNFATPYPFGLDLATADNEGRRIFWSYLSTRTPWTYAGFPSHWALDSSVPLSAGAAVGATAISVSGLEANKLACIRGQYVQIGRRLYVATATVQASGTGTATLPIAPGLLAAANTGDAVRLVEAACEMRLAVQDFEESAQAGTGFVSVSASFIETVTDAS